jgi:hypothetical protein
LLLNGRNSQGCGLGDLGVKCVDDGLGLAVLDLPSIGPLSIYLINDVLLLAFRIEDGRERVLLAGDPAFAAVIDARSVARGGLDVGAAVQLNVGRPCNEPFYVQGGECNEVVFVVRIEVEDRMADLLHSISVSLTRPTR